MGTVYFTKKNIGDNGVGVRSAAAATAKFFTGVETSVTPLVARLRGFLSRVSTLTRDIDIAILSVCPSVCLSVTFRYQMKTAEHVVIVFFHHTVAQSF